MIEQSPQNLRKQLKLEMKKSHFEAHKELMKQQIQVKIDKLN